MLNALRYKPIARLFRKPGLQKLKKKQIRSYQENAELYQDINYYCTFVGYPRSGHSLVGALLDAHPNIVMSHELDAFFYIQHDFPKEAIVPMIIENSRYYAANNREWEDFTYKVEGQWQGKHQQIKVVGDKKGGLTSLRLHYDLPSFKKIKKLGYDPKFIHVVRNPYDNITRILLKNEAKNLDAAIDFYFRLVEVNERIRKEYFNTPYYLEFKHEDLIASPERIITECLAFFELEPTEEYMTACNALIYNKPRKSREEIEWNEKTVQKVNSLAKKYTFLSDYTF